MASLPLCDSRKVPDVMGSGVMCSVDFADGGADKSYCGGCQTFCSSMRWLLEQED